MKLYQVVATDREGGIGKNGTLPWRLKKEMAYFKKLTLRVEDPSKQNMVVMGRTTWESIPEKFRPLKGRRNVVLTRNTDFIADGAEVVHSIDDALALADDTIENVHIIGGATIYEQTIHDERLDGVYLTKIDHEYECDRFFPELPERFSHVEVLGSEEEGDVSYEYQLITT